jgi:DNA sulfur modification protein DndD
MLLKRITFINFRQFYGKQSLGFSTDPNQNVTLIHAENGVGKTTILNAILWAFYGRDLLTTKFEQKEHIINFTAASEGVSDASVEVLFTFRECDYLVRRTHQHNGGAKNTEDLDVFKVDQGNHVRIRATQSFLNSVIPSGMAKYFFFDGEHAEAFTGEGNRKEVSKAVRSMLGCDLARSALEDLKASGRSYQQTLTSLPDQKDLTDLERQLEKIQSEQEDNALRLEKAKDDRDLLVALREKAIDALGRYKEIQALTGHRESLKDGLRRLKAQIDNSKLYLITWVGSKAIDVLSKRLAKTSLDFLDEESFRGRIPSPYNEQFVRDLLEKQMCICGRSLNAGTEEFVSVYRLIESAGNAEAMGRVVRARSRIHTLQSQAPEARKALLATEKELAALQTRERQLEDEIQELDKRILDYPLDEIQAKERERQELDKRIGELDNRLGACRLAERSLAQKVDRFTREISELAHKNGKSRVIIERVELLNSAYKTLETALENYERDARLMITKKVNGVIEETTRRYYQFNMDDHFAINLSFPNGTSVPKSGGENQLMGLAFIAALVDFAKDRIGDANELLTPGTAAPLVLDSPFGQLDKTYRASVIKFVPQMAGQVVLLVSSSQGNEDIPKILKPKVGMEYVLVDENREDQGTKHSENLILHGREYQTVKYGCERTQTRIQEVQG